MDNPTFEETNVNDVVDNFVSGCQKIFNATYGTDIMIPFGTDFTYQNAFMW
jgi:hypothetical protein